jgi:hypothetical protein
VLSSQQAPAAAAPAAAQPRSWQLKGLWLQGWLGRNQPAALAGWCTADTIALAQVLNLKTGNWLHVYVMRALHC